VLKVESIAASIPPDVPLPAAQNVREEAILENAIAEIEQEAAEVEDMPDGTPEEEEQEVEDEMNGGHDEPVSDDAPPVDNEGRMPGQLPTAADQTSSKDYHSIKRAAKEKIASLLGQEITVGTRNNGGMRWKVIDTYEPSEESLLPEFESQQFYGLKNFSTSDYKRSEVLVQLFLHLTFIDWKDAVALMNNAVLAEKCKCRKFTAEEFLVGLGLIIGASEFSLKGVDLFGVKDQIDLDDDVLWHSISASPHFKQYMTFNRFKDFRRFFTSRICGSNKS